jgi:putative phosphoesterase
LAARAALIADTHVSGSRRLPARCVELLAGADLVLHAGDISTPAALAEIEAIGPPVHAVHGNVDAPELVRRLPAELTLTAEGVRLALIHDAGPAAGRLQRMRRRFPDADVVVFGHSHMPLHEEEDGFQLFNPGSPTQRRRAPRHTIGIAVLDSGGIILEHVALD